MVAQRNAQSRGHENPSEDRCLNSEINFLTIVPQERGNRQHRQDKRPNQEGAIGPMHKGSIGYFGLMFLKGLEYPTEGGLATGLEELAISAKVGLEVELDRIPVLPECQEVCVALGIEPLGLLASGALLLTVADQDTETIKGVLRDCGVGVTSIGRVLPQEEGLQFLTSGGVRAFPSFTRDELARYLDRTF